MYNYRIENVQKKLAGTIVYFLSAFVIFNIAQIVSVNLYLVCQITVYKYDVIKYLIYQMLTMPLLCGYVMFLIDDNAGLKSVFSCYLSKHRFMDTFLIFIMFNLPCVLLNFISSFMTGMSRCVVLIFTLIIGLQQTYQIIDFAKHGRCRIKLFFNAICYKKLLITVLILMPLYILYAVLATMFNYEVGQIGGDFFSNILMYGLNLVILPAYFIFFNNNVCKDV